MDNEQMKSCNICNRCNSGRVNHVITWNDNRYYLCDACFYPYIEINNLCFELNFHYLNNHFDYVKHIDFKKGRA